MKKILRNLIDKDQQDLIELNYRDERLTIRKKVIKERTRSIKIDLTEKEAERMMFFLEGIFYEGNYKNEN